MNITEAHAERDAKRTKPWLLSIAAAEALFAERWPRSRFSQSVLCPDDHERTDQDCPTCGGVGNVPERVERAFEAKITTVYKVVQPNGGRTPTSACSPSKIRVSYSTDNLWTFPNPEYPFPLLAFADQSAAYDWAKYMSIEPDDMYEVWKADGFNVRPAPLYLCGLPLDILHLGLAKFWAAVESGKSYSCVMDAPKGSVICDRIRLRKCVHTWDEFQDFDEEGQS